MSPIRMTRFGWIAVAASVLCLGNAEAATKTTTFQVTATILADCNLSATDLAFGNYDATGASPNDASSTISVHCTTGTTYTVALGIGSGGGTFATRTMASGGNTLPYNLYTAAARSVIWGDGTASTATIAGTGSGLLATNPHTVYGRIAAGLDRAPGNYASTITVTITF